MLAATGALAVLSFTGTATAAAVLGLTFVLGSGMATTFVVYQSLTPEMVTRAELPAAVALNGVGINLARAAGPALAGLLIAVLSAGALFSIEAALMAAVIVVVMRPRPSGPPAAGSSWPRPCGPGCASCGSRGRCGARPRRAFSLFASGLWALLPVVALDRLDLGSRGFGVLMGCVGAGAVTGAALLRRADG